MDRRKCKHFEWKHIYKESGAEMEHVCDEAYCTKKDCEIDNPSCSDEYMDHYITCPCKTHYEEVKK